MATAVHLPCRYLGNSGLKVSTLCLGAMTFGQQEVRAAGYVMGPARNLRHLDRITYYGTWILYFASEMYTHTVVGCCSKGGCGEGLLYPQWT